MLNVSWTESNSGHEILALATCRTFVLVPTGRYQSMKPMIGKSIDALLVNWHRLALTNR